MGFKKISSKSRYQERKKYSRFRKIQRFKRDRMEFQDLLRKIRTFLRHMKPVHFLFSSRNIFRYIRFVLVFSTNLGGLWNSPWKMQSRFSRREHPRNTNRSLFPIFLLFSFFSLTLYYSSFLSAFHESSRGRRRVFHRHRLLVKMQNGVENFSDRAVDTSIPRETWEK